MKSREEILNKIHEMMEYELKSIARLDKAQMFWEKQGYRETAEDMKNSSRTHLRCYVALKILLEFADED